MVEGTPDFSPSLPVDGDFFAALAENVPAIVYSATAIGEMEFFNAHWYAYTGLSREQTLNETRGFRDAIHPEDVERTSAAWWKSMETGEGNTIEARVRRHDGVYRWHRSSLVPVRNAEGRLARWIGCVYDVDEEQRAERTMRSLGDALPILTWTATPDGKIDYYNERWTTVFGETDGLRDGRARHFVHPNDAPDLLAAYETALKSGNPYDHVFRLRMRDGRYRWHRVAASPIVDEQGNIRKWFGVTNDIHDAISTQIVEERDVEAQLVRDIARRTRLLLFLCDENLGVTFTSEEWTELTGAPREQLLGNGMEALIHPDDVAAVASAWNNRTRTGESIIMQYRLRRSDGTYRWIETRTRPDLDAEGRVTQWVGTGHDIDEHKRALKALEYLVQTTASVTQASSLDDQLRGLAAAALDGMADICVIDALDASALSAQRLVVTSKSVPQHIAAIIRGYVPPPVTAEVHPTARAMYRGESTFVARVPSSFWETPMLGDRHAGWIAVRPHSFMAIPIASGGTTYGAITLLRTVTTTPFERDDMRVLEDVASRAALAIANAKLRQSLERESRDQLERFRRIADSSPQVTFAFRPDGSLDWINRRWYEYTGIEDASDEGWYDAIHVVDREELRERWLAALQAGEAFTGEARVRGRDGAYRWFLIQAVPERGPNDEILQWYASYTDIHEARRASRTLSTFADLGAALSETLGLQQTLDAIMLVLVPEYADWAFITLADEDRELRIAAIEAAYAPDTALLRKLVGHRYLRGGARDGSIEAVERRRPFLFDEDSIERARLNLNDEAYATMSTVGFTSVLSLPIVVNAHVRGTMVLCNSSSQRTFERDELPFYQEIARRVAPAIANAELYERERHAARSFQDAALPGALPRVPGMSFHAVYEAGRAEALVGGDWYDAFTLLDGRIVVSIGDVAGSGLGAAVLMSSVRQTIRGVAQVHADPSLMLEAADRTVSAEHPDRYVTAFVGVIDPMTGEIVYQSAGHLPPLVVRPNGSIDELKGGGLPLGLRTEHEPDNRRAMLAPGSLLVLFTDGLVEVTHDLLAGERHLRAALSQDNVRTAENPAEALHDLLLSDGSKDDAAILVVSIGTPPAIDALHVPSAFDEKAVRFARREILDRLHEGGLSNSALAHAELILAELIGNLARYAPGPATFSLTWNGDVPVLHLLDSGPGYHFAAKLPPDVFSETGRGLFLVAALARNFVVTPRPEGGSYSRIVFKR